MNPSRKTPADAGSDDPWEQLAEDLFGLEFGKEHAAAVPVRETEAVAPAPAPAAIERPAVPETSDEPRPAKAPLGGASPAADLPETSSAAPVAFDEIPVRPATPSAQDSYWDALANWKWDESEAPGGKGKPSGPRPDAPRGGRPQSRQESRPEPRPDSRQGERPARSAPPASGPAASARAEKAEFGKSDEFGDFGLGVGSSPSSGATPSRREAAEAAGLEAGRGSADDDASESDELEETEDFTNDEEAGESAGPAGGDENAPRKRRRRRRRRRSRSGEGAATGSAVSGEPRVAADREKPVEPARPRSEESPRAPEREGGRERHRRDEESRPPRRGRRDRRGRGAPVADERHEFSDDEFGALSTDDEPMNAGDDVHSDHPADDDGDFGEPAVNYDDVPTWEEAISYLLHPNQVQVESSGSSGSAPGGAGSSEQSRQNRHYGGRRR
jgi:hypothetical protein